MTTMQAIDTLRYHQRWRRDEFAEGDRVMVRSHGGDYPAVVARVIGSEAGKRYVTCDNEFIAPQDIARPDPARLGKAIDMAINALMTVL